MSVNQNPEATSTRPYLIRAWHEWCCDNGFTPYITVAVDNSVQVPREYVKDDEIVLNIGFDATTAPVSYTHLDVYKRQPYYSVHDVFGVSVFLFVFSAVVFFAPEMGGYFLEYNNFIPADPFQTPLHIAPVWYFTPFYTCLLYTSRCV